MLYEIYVCIVSAKGNAGAELYDIWLSMQQFWGAGGPMELGHFPTDGADMKKALLLRQNHIIEKKIKHCRSSLPSVGCLSD